MRRFFNAFAAATLGLFAGSAAAQDYPWKPDRPITLIVPWAAGGSGRYDVRRIPSGSSSRVRTASKHGTPVSRATTSPSRPNAMFV